MVKLVKPNQATIAIENLRYLPLSGKTFQFFLEPAKGRASRIEANSFTFSSPSINPDNPPANTKASFNSAQGTLSLEYSFFNLTPGESYFVRVVETEQLAKEKQTYGITTRSFRTKSFESLDENPDFQTPSSLPLTYPHLSASNAVIKLPPFPYLGTHSLKVLYRRQEQTRFQEAKLQNTGSQLLAYLEQLRASSKYEFIVEDSEANLLLGSSFTTLEPPHLDLARTTHTLKDSTLVFSLLGEHRNQPLKLKLYLSKTPHFKAYSQTLSQQSSSDSLEFSLSDLKPDQTYFFQLFDSQEQLISQGEFQTPPALAFSFAPSTTSTDFFYQKTPSPYNRNAFSNPPLFLEYRRIGEPRFTKQVIHPKTDGESFGLLSLQNLEPASTYEYRFLTLQNGNFFTLGAGYFLTLAQNSLHQVVEPLQTDLTKQEYVFEFSTPQHQD